MVQRRTWWVALAMAVLILLAAEQAARPYFRESRRLYCEHPVRFWALSPNTEAFDEQSHWPIRVNALGLRGEEFDPARPGPRMILLGDSCIFGAGVKDEDTLDRYLEAELRARTGQAWTVVNGGVPGYSTFQGLDLFEDVGPVVRADVAVFAYLYADRSGDPCADHERQAGPPLSNLRRLLWKSALYRVLRARMMGRPVEATLRLEDIDRTGTRDRVPVDRYNQNLRRLARRARDFGASQAVFLKLPNLRKVDPHGPSQAEALLATGAQAGIVVDAYEAWARAGLLQPEAFLPGDALHFSAEGNRRLARTLVDDLIARGVLPPAR